MRTNYNIEREKLHLPEYGRHIQDMVDELMRIENREERNLRARALIAILANIQHTSSDTPDFERKLWDHLFIISDFQLDVDSPYPQPTREELEPTPRRLNYPQSFIRFKHYGKYVGRILKSLSDCPADKSIDATVGNIARYMRTKSYEYNLDHPNNEVIIKDIKILSGNSIEIDEQALNNIRSDYKHNSSAYSQRNKGRQQQTKGKNRPAMQQKNHKKTATRHNNTQGIRK